MFEDKSDGWHLMMKIIGGMVSIGLLGATIEGAHAFGEMKGYREGSKAGAEIAVSVIDKKFFDACEANDMKACEGYMTMRRLFNKN